VGSARLQLGRSLQVILHIPNTVFVPFEWNGNHWVKRDDLPRFKEPEEAAQYLLDNPTVSRRDGKPVFLQWREHHESALIHEYLRGVGTPEWLTLRH
jgi:hypothetical protein